MTFSVNNKVAHGNASYLSSGILDMLQLQMDIETAYEQLDDNFKHLAEVEDAMTNIHTATDILKNCTDAKTAMKILDIDGGLESIGIAIESAIKVKTLEGLLGAAATGAKQFVAYIARIISVMLGLIAIILEGIGILLGKIPGIGKFLEPILFGPGHVLYVALEREPMQKLYDWGFTKVQVEQVIERDKPVASCSANGLLHIDTLNLYSSIHDSIFAEAFERVKKELDVAKSPFLVRAVNINDYLDANVGKFVDLRLSDRNLPVFIYNSKLHPVDLKSGTKLFADTGWSKREIKQFVDSGFKRLMDKYTDALNKAKRILNKMQTDNKTGDTPLNEVRRSHIRYACGLMRQVIDIANCGIKTCKAQLSALVQLGKVVKAKADELGVSSVPGGSPEV